MWRWACVLGGVVCGAWGCAGASQEESAPRQPPVWVVEKERRAEYEVWVEPGAAVVELSLKGAVPDPLPLGALEGPEGWPKLSHLYDVQARTQEGARLDVSREEGRWVVSGAAGRPYVVRWLVVDQRPELAPSEGWPGRDLRVPYTAQENFMAWGRGVLLAPQGEAAKGWDVIQAEVHAPKNWPITTSWGRPSARVQGFEELGRALWCAGPGWRVSQQDAGGTLVQVAALGEFDEGPWASVVRRMLVAQNEMFGRYPVDAMLVVLAPGPAASMLEGGALGLAVPTELGPKDPTFAEPLAELLARRWFGQALQPKDPRAERWFVEGFSAYYATRTLLATGLMDGKSFRDRANNLMRLFVTHPLAGMSGRAELAQSLDPRYQSIARWKGWLLACLFDMELRGGSQGAKTLDHYVRRLGLDAAPEGFGVAELRQKLDALSGGSWGEFFERHIEGSEPLPLERLDQGGLVMAKTGFPIFHVGFEAQSEGFVNVRITRVLPRSQAAQVGVQEGDKVESIQIGASMEQPVKLTVRREGASGLIQFEYFPIWEVELPLVGETTALFDEWFRP